MGKIVRLTESDLVKIVKRVIREDATAVANNGSKAFQLIKSAMDGIGTDEEQVSMGVFTIKNKADYDTCLSLVKKEGYNTIMKYIATDMSYGDGYDETQAAPIKNFGQLDNNPFLDKFETYLQRFNPKETIK